MASALTSVSIKTRLYLLVLCSTLFAGLMLGLSLYVLGTYRINGPVYAELRESAVLKSELEPAVLCVTQPYITLHELDSTEKRDEIDALLKKFDAQVRNYERRRDY